MLAFVAGQFDMTFPYEVTVPNMKDIKSQMPNAVCEIAPTNFAPNLLMNRKPPFDNPELRKAAAMTIDHQAFVDILGQGKGDIGTAMLPGPEGQRAMPNEMRELLPGYAPDVAKSREEARKIMQSLGYGPVKHLPLKIAARNLPDYRDAASLLIWPLAARPSLPLSRPPRPDRGQVRSRLTAGGSRIRTFGPPSGKPTF